MKEIINTNNAPAPVGPYSQAVRAGDYLFISGQIPFLPDGRAEGGDIEAQTRRCIENLKAIVEEAGGNLENIVKTTVLMKDLKDFSRMNEVYNGYFEGSKPARAAYQVCELPKGVDIEIEAIAYFG